MLNVTIARPEHLEEDRIAKAYSLYRRHLLPKSIEGWMLAVPIHHELRAIFGSTSAACWWLMRSALTNWWALRWARWNWIWYRLPWWLAVAWTEAWATWRLLRGGAGPATRMWGRLESPEPTICKDCGWRGPRRWTVHNSEPFPVEDECPRCGSVV